MAEGDGTLLQAMDAALADTFMFYVEAHLFHWNVIGPRFSQLHELFGDIYEDAFEAADGLAERIRTLDELAPLTTDQLIGPAKVKADTPITDADEMVLKLLADNEIVSRTLDEAQAKAEASDNVGIANFLQERIDRHAKWNWMLTATSEPIIPRSERRYSKAREA